MKILILLILPILCFSQNKGNYNEYFKIALNDIKNKDFVNAILSLDKTLELKSNDPVSLYFKGHSQIIIGKQENGCKTLIDAIYYQSNSAKKLYAEKCIDYDPKLNIERFKSGKFSLQILDDTPLVYTFERKNNMQYESYEDKIYTGEILWFKNGDYTIVANKSTEDIMSENPDFTIRVLKIEKNEYLYERIEENQVQFGLIKKL